MNSNTISYSTPFNSNNGTAAKRKLEDDDYLIMSHKRLYKLNTQHQEQYKENTTLPIMAQTTSSFTFNHNNINNNNSNNDMSQDTQDSDNSDDKLQQGQVEMMDYDLTDEDESLQTPSSMNDFTVIEEDESDFIGDLEKGWIEMFNESYYPYY